MRLRVIGSSPAWPNPGSAQSGYLLEGEGRLLLDCGPGVLARLRAEGALDVDAIAITHFHLDHWGDIVPWAWLAAYGSEDVGRPDLWVPPGGADQLEQFAALWGNLGMFDRAFDVHEFTDGVVFGAAGFEIEPRRVPHFDLGAYGFRVRGADGALLAYSGDAGPGAALDELARDADLFLCEATLEHAPADGVLRGHLTAEEAVAAADGRPFLLTHRPAELDRPDGLPLAHDGLVVEIEPV